VPIGSFFVPIGFQSVPIGIDSVPIGNQSVPIKILPLPAGSGRRGVPLDDDCVCML
jgi:hypothetical protein